MSFHLGESVVFQNIIKQLRLLWTQLHTEREIVRGTGEEGEGGTCEKRSDLGSGE